MSESETQFDGENTLLTAVEPAAFLQLTCAVRSLPLVGRRSQRSRASRKLGEESGG